MLSIPDFLISLIAPHQCLACGVEGQLLCPACVELLPQVQPQCYCCGKTIDGFKTCKSCRKQTPLDAVYVCTEYDSFARALVQKLKFERARSAAGSIAHAIDRQFEMHVSAVFVPIPTATSRVRQRGYDQSVLIAQSLARRKNMPWKRALVRYGQQRQTGSGRKQRLAQLDGALQVRKSATKGVSHVILIDDVLTTGATLETAARALKAAGVKRVSAIVFARAK